MRRLQRHRLVVVHGGSGSGKSSLIFAGVLPQLQRRRRRQGARLAILSMRPGSTPLRTLAATLHGFAAETRARSGVVPIGAPSLDDVRVILARGRLAAGDLDAMVAAAGCDQLCLYVDQFEELFRYAPETDADEARLFADVLVGLAGPDPEDADSDAAVAEPDPATAQAGPHLAPEGTHVALPRICAVVTMRSEFLGDCARYSDLAETVNRTQYLLPNMRRPDLLRAIREPAGLFGGSVAWELADRLARDAVREDDPLPLVQHALMRLWDKHGPTLMLGQYEDATASSDEGGGLAFRTGLGQMLATHANEALAAAAPNGERRDVAEHLFRALTDIDREGRAVRREQRMDKLREVADPTGMLLGPILDAFRADGVSFLRPSSTEQPALTESDDIDIGHEALIRSWPRVADPSASPKGPPRGWLHREFQDGLAWRALAARALEFEKDPELALPPATTESRWPWFQAVRRRPAWALRYLIDPVPGLPIEQQPEWLAVTRLMEASYKALQTELSLLDHETQLRADADRREADLRQERNRRLIPALVALLLIASLAASLAAFMWSDASDQRDAAVTAKEQAETARENAEAARRAQVSARTAAEEAQAREHAALLDANKAAIEAQNARDQAQRDADQRLADLASAVQTALKAHSFKAVHKVIAPYLADRAASQVQSDVEVETPTPAALQVAEKVRADTPAALRGVDGFMWIGSATQPRLADPKDISPITPEAVQPGGQYRVTRPTIVRLDMPTEDTYRTAASIGFVTEGSLIQVLGIPKGYDRPSGTQYWVRLRVQPDQDQIAAGYRAAALDALLSHQVEPALGALAKTDPAQWLKQLTADVGKLPQPADDGGLSPKQAKAWNKLYTQLVENEQFLAGLPADLVNRLKSTIGAAPPERQPTVWFQFNGVSRDKAQTIADALNQRNYLVPGEERRRMTPGLHEVRYYYRGDEPLAHQLSADAGAILEKLGYPSHDVAVKDFTTYSTKPQPGMLELWLDL